MNDIQTSPAELADDHRIAGILQEWLTDLEAGRKPDRAALLAQWPDFASTLAEALDGLEIVHAASPSKNRPLSSALAPSQLGDFRILREVGRGGMGIVYEAEQLSLGRRVALKVLPFASALDDRHLQRFKNEAQAAAHLHHTNIVPVFAVGSDRGVHYYAMQFIEGQTLSELIREMRHDAGADTPSSATGPYGGPAARSASKGTRETTKSTAATSLPGLNGSERFKSLARLGSQAADALEYAHGMGVVHRDIKPANLLVDARGNVWITDFGLALMHGGGELTVSGDMLGTLRYMSPEQAAGRRADVDHHADIYSLGVTLYELFTLHDPFPARDREEMLRRILHEEPRPPRRVRRDLPAELETILLKAMAKAPAERYASAQAFGDDLRRFLNDQPILARRPTLAQVAGKWARRHRGFVRGLIAVMALSCVALAVVVAVLDAQKRKTEAALGQARAAWQETRHAFDTLYQEVAERAMTGDPRRLAEQRAFLEKALDFYERFAGEYGDDPQIRLEQARAYHTAGDIRQNLGEVNKSAEMYVNARNVLDGLIRDYPGEIEYRRLLARCCNSQGVYCMHLGKLDDAEASFTRAMAIQTEILRANQADRKARLDLAKHGSNVGAIQLEQRKYDDARQTLEEALAQIERYLAETPKPTAADRRQLARTHHNLGVVFHRTDRPELAKRHWDKDHEISAELVKANPFDAQFLDDLASSTLSIGVLSCDGGRFADAERYFREAQEGYSKLLAQYPNVPSYRSDFARCTFGLARSLSEQGKLPEARQVLEKSESVLERLAGEYPDIVAFRLDLLRSRIDHANLLADAGQLADAVAIGQRAWSEAAAGAGKLPPMPDVRLHWLKLRNNLADYSWRLGERSEALDGFRAAAEIGVAMVADFPTSAEYCAALCGVRANLARLLQQLEQYDEAEHHLRATIADYGRLAAEAPGRPRWMAKRAWGYVRLGELHERRGRPADAEAARKAAVNCIETMLRQCPEDTTAFHEAAWFFVACPHLPSRNVDRACNLTKCLDATTDAGAASTLGLVRLRQGEGEDAVEALETARKLNNSRDYATDLLLAMAYDIAGQSIRARQHYEQVCATLAATRAHGEDLERFRAEADEHFRKARQDK